MNEEYQEKNRIGERRKETLQRTGHYMGNKQLNQEKIDRTISHQRLNMRAWILGNMNEDYQVKMRRIC